MIDTHTAVASHVYRRYKKESGDEKVTVIASTASPYKFTGSVIKAIDPSISGTDDFELADKLSALSNVPVPEAVSSLKDAPVLHDIVCDKSQMKETVRKLLGI